MLARHHRTSGGKDEGFTLIELLVVMIIIGVLAAIAVPVFLTQRQKAADASAKSDVTSAGKEIATYYVDKNGTFSGAIAGGVLTLTDNSTPAIVRTIKLSPNTEAPAAPATIVTYLAGGTCTNATGWYVHLRNTGGDQKDWFYSAQGGLTDAAPAACA